jgi:hypothetical protein
MTHIDIIMRKSDPRGTIQQKRDHREMDLSDYSNEQLAENKFHAHDTP